MNRIWLSIIEVDVASLFPESGMMRSKLVLYTNTEKMAESDGVFSQVQKTNWGILIIIIIKAQNKIKQS